MQPEVQEEEIEDEEMGVLDRLAKVLLIHDCFSGHLTADVNQSMAGRMAVACRGVPRKMTGTAQIADTHVFRKFKSDLDDWILRKLSQLSQEWGKLSQREWRDLLIEGICECWYNFPDYLLLRGGTATGVTIALDGSEDGLTDLHTADGILSFMSSMCVVCSFTTVSLLM